MPFGWPFPASVVPSRELLEKLGKGAAPCDPHPVAYFGKPNRDLQKACGSIKALGCTRVPNIRLDCDCAPRPCDSETGECRWMPNPSMRIPTIEVHYSTDCYDTDKIISEENRHVLVYQDRICKAQRRMADFRQETFSSEAACQAGLGRGHPLAVAVQVGPLVDRSNASSVPCDGSIAW